MTSCLGKIVLVKERLTTLADLADLVVFTTYILLGHILCTSLQKDGKRNNYN